MVRHARHQGRHTRSRVPKFSDPWSFRKRTRPHQVADWRGRPAEVRTYTRNGALVQVLDATHQATPLERSQIGRLRRLVAAEIARYRIDNVLSAKELRTAEALWRDGLNLREHARREGVTPQAIEARIQAMQQRAVRFCLWWRAKNRMRAR